LLRETVPTLSRILYLWNGLNPGNADTFSDFQAIANGLGVQVYSLDLRSADVDLGAAFASAAPSGTDGVVNSSDPLLNTLRGKILEFAAALRLPANYDQRDWVDAGGLTCYGPNFSALWRSAADYVDRILKGANPAEMPIAQPTSYEFVVKLRTTESLGLTLPPAVAATAITPAPARGTLHETTGCNPSVLQPATRIFEVVST
jgi:putative ABC transport system substrate-binding protein